MIEIMKEKIFIQKKFTQTFLSKKDLANLNNLGHTIGLHSHSHQ